MSHKTSLFYTLVLLSSSMGADIVHGTDEGDRHMSPLHTRHHKVPQIVTARDKSPLKLKSPQTSPRDEAENAGRRFPVIVPARVGKVQVVVGKLEDESSYELPLVDIKDRAFGLPKKNDTSESDLQNSVSSSLKEVGSFENINFGNLTTALSMLKENEPKSEPLQEKKKRLEVPKGDHKGVGEGGRKSPRRTSLAKPLQPEDTIFAQEGTLHYHMKPLDLAPIGKAHESNERLVELSKRVRMGASHFDDEVEESVIGRWCPVKSSVSVVPHLPMDQIMSPKSSAFVSPSILCAGSSSGSGHPSPVSPQKGLSLEQVSFLSAIYTFEQRRTTFFWDLEQQKDQNIILKSRENRETDEVYNLFKKLNFKEYFQEVGQGKKDAITRDAKTILLTLLFIADDFEDALSYYSKVDKGRFSDNVLMEKSKTLERLHKFFEGYSMMLALLHTSVWSVTPRKSLTLQELSPDKLASAQLTYVVGMSSLGALMQDFKESIEARRSQLRAEDEAHCQEQKESHSSSSPISYTQPKRKKSSPSEANMSYTRTDSVDQIPTTKKTRQKNSGTQHTSSGEGSPKLMHGYISSAGLGKDEEEHKRQGIGSKLRGVLTFQ